MSIPKLPPKEGLGDRAPVLMVVNRRFSPLAVKMKSLLDDLEMPKSFIMTVNAETFLEIIGHRTQRLAVGVLLEKCAILLIFLDFLLDLQSYPQTSHDAAWSFRYFNCSIGI